MARIEVRVRVRCIVSAVDATCTLPLHSVCFEQINNLRKRATLAPFYCRATATRRVRWCDVLVCDVVKPHTR